MTEHEKAIIEAAEKARDWWVDGKTPTGGSIAALTEAVDAKREAERLKLLTAEEAMILFGYDASDARAENNENHADMQAVLDADRASVLRVIEALPDSGRTDDKWVRVADICGALLPPNPLTKGTMGDDV